MEIERFSSRADASVAAAGLMEAALREQLVQAAGAGLVVSGGSTPVDCLACLARASLPWARISVTLSDERCVPVTDAASNERMVRERLLVGAAAETEFVPLTADGLARMPMPFAAVLLGMGEDGHFASIFPDAAELAEALDLDNPEPCFTVTTAASPHPRVSMTLARLLASELIVLLAFGAAKRRILEDPHGYPVARVLSQTRTAVRVLWAP